MMKMIRKDLATRQFSEHKWIAIGVRLPKDFVANHAFYDYLFRLLRKTYTTNYDC